MLVKAEKNHHQNLATFNWDLFHKILSFVEITCKLLLCRCETCCSYSNICYSENYIPCWKGGSALLFSQAFCLHYFEEKHKFFFLGCDGLQVLQTSTSTVLDNSCSLPMTRKWQKFDSGSTNPRDIMQKSYCLGRFK